MKRATRLAAAAALATVLSGCLSDGLMTYGSSYPSYDPAAPRQVGASGAMQVTLNGSPFAASDVVGAMNAQPNVHGLVFSPDANPAQSGYRIALNFTTNAPNPCSPDAGNSMPLGNDSTRLQLVASFCRFGGMLSRTTAVAPRPVRPEDPEFRRFMHAVVVELLPAFKPNGVENGDCPSRPNC
ncbi:MAG: hypothetical protein HY059_00175 [Proteobacteria bacterium]|nr:hypothetical protein [Pseudomonadota bacterium]